MRLPDPRAARSERVLARCAQAHRRVDDPEMAVRVDAALYGDTGVDDIIAVLPPASTVGLPEWPDRVALADVARLGTLFSLQAHEGVVDPGLYLAAVSGLQKLHDNPVINALYEWVAWMYFLGGTATSEAELRGFFDSCLVHAGDLRAFASDGLHL